MKTRFEAEVDAMPKVDKNVPLPRQSGGKWGQLLASMKAGDSFVVNTNAERNTALQAAASGNWGLANLLSQRDN